MTLLAINWAHVGIQIAQLLLSLSILVILHEFGHYITARMFGCRVERFFLFFDPWFALVKKKVGDTVYGIGWLPLGGYVKIAGMIDESMDKAQLALPPQPWEFRSKPAWQRLIIMIGGVTVNIILAFIIYAGILMVWGKHTTPLSSVKNGISIQDSVMYDLGFRDGDNILAANGKPLTDYNRIIKKAIVSDSMTVLRGGKRTEIIFPVDFIGQLVEKKRSGTPLIQPRIPALVQEVPDSMPAYKAGLRSGDLIVAINGTATPFYDQLRTQLAKSKFGDTASVTYVRKGDTLNVAVPLNAQGKLGVYPMYKPSQYEAAGVIKTETKKYGFFAAIPAGVAMAGDELEFYIDQFRKILSPKTGAYKGVGGFKSMGSIFLPQWDWESFWTLTAFFSIVLAFMNLLPIPALDGGHVLFTLIEMITGRKPNQKFLEYAQTVGMILLLGLMLYANGNDWLGWGRNK
ncbi:MAG: RIP metalloprotease RseP [Bacteroidetes bacterium]|nr:MAG: RIP metalloprotease RseP [Bacteroidota bacterium]